MPKKPPKRPAVMPGRKQNNDQMQSRYAGEAGHSSGYKYGGRLPDTRPTAKRARNKPGTASGRSR
jgi:hypothetical protein